MLTDPLDFASLRMAQWSGRAGGRAAAPYNAAFAIRMARYGSLMKEQQPIAVLGGGSFGTAIANLLAHNGRQVCHWMRDADQAEAIREQRENPRYLKGVKIHPGVQPVTDLDATLDACGLIFVALPSSALRPALQAYGEVLA